MITGSSMNGLRIFFVFLVMFSFSITTTAATEPTGELNGDNLTLSYLNFSKGATYRLDFPESSFNETIKDDGKLVLNISNSNLYPESLKNLTLRKSFDVTVTNISDNLATKITVINKNPPAPTSTPTPAPTPSPTTPAPTTPAATTPEITTAPTETPPQGILSKLFSNVYINLALFLLGLAGVFWGLYKLGLIRIKTSDENESEQRLVSPSIATLTNKLQIDLLDESGFVRITDAKVRAVNKSGMPYLARIEFDGTYHLELPKGTYKIEVDGGGNYESTSREVNIPSDDERIKISLIKRQPVQIEVVDEAGNPISGINVSVKETTSLVDANGSPGVTDASGIAKFTISKNKQYVVSIRSSGGEFVEQKNIPLSSSETTKRIQLFKKAGTLDITISEQATGKPFAGTPVSLMKKGASQAMDFATDDNGRINQKLSIGDYIVRLKTSIPSLYDPVEKQVTIIENRTCAVTLDLRFNYQPKPEFLNSISKINEKLNTGFKEVSTYDTCIPLFFKKVGEKPTQLVDKIIKRPVEFLGAKTSPDEIIKYTLSTTEFLADEISRIMREKSNVDFYFSIQNLPPVDDLTVSDYSPEKFSELVRDTANYHKNHFRDVGNKLNEIDNELTQLSGTLTIQPVADLWRVAQKLLENSMNEADAKKRGVMLFIDDKLLDHVREMYNKEEVKARLAISMF